MRGGLDRLQKEIDALSYNSRSVLNALIRSTVVSGSSKGYTATRVGVEIVLTRVDIYRLYRFYQEWETNEYATETGYASNTQRSLKSFDDIRSELDLVPVINDDGTKTTGSTTDALVKHSKILYMTSLNVGSINDTTFWLGLIADAKNPKLISNSAPIPINLRTPVFDENLATTRFNQNPTYLFPNGYYLLDAFGYSGDDNDHRADGKSWTVAGDTCVNLEAPAIAMGLVLADADRKTALRRNGNRDANGDLTPVTYSTVWGLDTHARGIGSTSGGLHSIVTKGAECGIAIGRELLNNGIDSVLIGGTRNYSVNNYISVTGGVGNVASAAYSSIVGGFYNTTGSEVHSFKFPITDVASSSCVIIDSVNCDSSYDTSAIGRNVIVITGNVVSSYSVNDTVILFDFAVSYESSPYNYFHSTHGDGIDRQQLKIVSVEYNSTIGNVNYGKTLITLNGDIAPNTSNITAGRIVKIYDSSRNEYIGAYSLVTGYGNIGYGDAQTVVGKYNYIHVDTFSRRLTSTPRFVVGSGSTSLNRGNSFEVWDDFVNLQATPRNSTMFGSKSTSSGVYSGIELRPYDILVRSRNAMVMIGNDEPNFGNSTNRIYLGHGGASCINIVDNSSRYNMEIKTDGNGFKLYSSEIPLFSDYITGTVDYGDDVLIASGRYSELRAATHARITSPLITLTASTRATISVGNTSDSLRFRGNTFNALVTDQYQLAHPVASGTVTSFTSDGTTTASKINRTGFYRFDNTVSLLTNYIEINDAIGNTSGLADSGILCMNISGSVSTSYRNEGISLYTTGGYSDVNANKNGRIAVRKYYDNNGTYTYGPVKELAWLDDVSTIINNQTSEYKSVSDSVAQMQITNYSNTSNSYTMNAPYDGMDSYVDGSYSIINSNTMVMRCRIKFTKVAGSTTWTSGSYMTVTFNFPYKMVDSNTSAMPGLGRYTTFGKIYNVDNNVRLQITGDKTIKIDHENTAVLDDGFVDFIIISKVELG